MSLGRMRDAVYIPILMNVDAFRMIPNAFAM